MAKRYKLKPNEVWFPIYSLGWSARQNGVPRSRNPHDQGTDEWQSWDYGWEDAGS